MCKNKQGSMLYFSKRLGVFFIAISWVIYGLIFVIPFLFVSIKIKVILFTILYFISHSMFWSGMVIVGKDMVTKDKCLNFLNWIKRVGFTGYKKYD